MCLERGNRKFSALLDHLPDDYNSLLFYMPLCPICDTEVDVDEFDVDREYVAFQPLPRDLDLAVGTEHGQRVQGAVADVHLVGILSDVHQRRHRGREAVVGLHEVKPEGAPS